jgi:processive 1,2-diacylglycerol beta-glucosyltransferase
VQRLDILQSTNEVYRTLYDDGYFALVEAVPWLVGWGYDANDPPFKLAKWISLWDRLNTTATAKAIKAFRPEIVVCTHFLPTRLASLMMTRGVLDAKLAVVTTDYDFQGLWLSSPFNHYFVARDETKAYMVAIGVPADRITVSGIPVRPVWAMRSTGPRSSGATTCGRIGLAVSNRSGLMIKASLLRAPSRP